MTNSADDPVPPERLPESLLAEVDSLSGGELDALLSYVEERVESDQSSLRADIEASAAGEVIDVERDGLHALVRAHPPADGTGDDQDEAGIDTDTTSVDTDVISLYHVRREYLADGTESLHWAYLGDVYNLGQLRCDACGRTLDEPTTVCPHCGSDEIHGPETDT